MSEITPAIKEAKSKADKPHRAHIGLGIAIVAMFAILLFQNYNLSSTLARRSPFMQYSVCYNERFAAVVVPYTKKAEPTVDAIEDLEDANNLKSKNHCPGLEVLKDK